jgi:mannose-6-phosphate isomerase-like protein (cupin superfamily)
MTEPKRGRLRPGADAPTTGETVLALVDTPAVLVEQILSSSSASDEVYVQARDEWVAVVEGAALLEVDGAPVELVSGDWIVLPAGVPHRVLRTEAGTSWLAVHTPPPRQERAR